ncbi:MAG: methyltransferase domain-containing protein [Balneolales bacterium]
MSNENQNAVEVARNYYNSEDADHFYATIWGGEDIHVGLYESVNESISDASRRNQERMLAHLNNKPGPGDRVIDLGSGYGGSARFMAERYGCKVVALNLSEVENERARKMNRDQGLDHLIDVMDGNFESIPFEDAAFNLVWSQDAFLHSPDRRQVIREVARIMKQGGEFVFTDPMQSDDCPEGVLQPIFDRIHLESMGSPKFYKETASNAGLELVKFDELTEHLKRHYTAVLNETIDHEEELKGIVSDEYIRNMKNGLQHWINGAGKGHLSWGIFHFIKK